MLSVLRRAATLLPLLPGLLCIRLLLVLTGARIVLVGTLSVLRALLWIVCHLNPPGMIPLSLGSLSSAKVAHTRLLPDRPLQHLADYFFCPYRRRAA